MAKKIKLALIIALALIVAACAAPATNEKYVERLKTWVGATEDQLISVWGLPNSTYQSDTTKYLSYIRSSTVMVYGIPHNYYCKTTFMLQGGTVYNASWEGNSCKSQ